MLLKFIFWVAGQPTSCPCHKLFCRFPRSIFVSPLAWYLPKYFRGTFQMTHKKQKFSCPYPECDYKAAKKKTVYEHQKIIHEGASLYQCNLCDAKFSRENVLEDHKIYKHNYGDVNAGVCKFCNRRFHQASALRRHVKREHSDNPYYCCKFCGVKFLARSGMYYHMKVRHNESSTKWCVECFCLISWSWIYIDVYKINKMYWKSLMAVDKVLETDILIVRALLNVKIHSASGGHLVLHKCVK